MRFQPLPAVAFLHQFPQRYAMLLLRLCLLSLRPGRKPSALVARLALRLSRLLQVGPCRCRRG
jgi:hypothetical protein